MLGKHNDIRSRTLPKLVVKKARHSVYLSTREMRGNEGHRKVSGLPVSPQTGRRAQRRKSGAEAAVVPQGKDNTARTGLGGSSVSPTGKLQLSSVGMRGGPKDQQMQHEREGRGDETPPGWPGDEGDCKPVSSRPPGTSPACETYRPPPVKDRVGVVPLRN